MADLGSVLSGLGEIAQGYQQYQGRQQLQQLEALRALAAQQQMQQHARQAQASALMWPALQQLNQQPSAPLPGLGGGGQAMATPDYSQGAIQGSPMPPPQAQGGQMAGLPNMPSTGLGAAPAPSSFAPTGYAPAPSGGYYDSGLPSSPAGAPPELKRQILSLEGNRDFAVGKAGELGPGQILPTTGRQYGYAPDQLVGPSGRQASGTIVDDLYRRSGGDWRATEVGYNRGPGAMEKFQRAGDSLDAVPNLAPAYKNAVRQDIIQTGLQMRQQGVPGPALQQSSRAASDAAASIDPAEWGRASLKRTMDAIDKAAPGADPTVKLIALQQIQKLLAPDEKMMAQLLMAQNKQQHAFEMEELKQSHRQALQQQSEGFRGQMQLQQEQFRMAQGAGGGKGYAATKMLELTDKDGQVRTVMAREGRGDVGWVDSFTGQPITIQPGERVKEVTAGVSGGRAGAQLTRQVGAGAEVAVDLENVVEQPVGTTIGPLGTVEPGKTIPDALKGDLARTLTKEDEINMQQAMSGLGRELSTLMNPVYGGNWASEQLQPLIPKEGYSIRNTLYGFARIKQAATNALQYEILPSAIPSKEQKEAAYELIDKINKTIPWTVRDVLNWERSEDQKQTFGEYAAEHGLVIGGAPGGASNKSNWEKVQ